MITYLYMERSTALDYVKRLEDFGEINPAAVDIQSDSVNIERLRELDFLFTWSQGIEDEVPYTAKTVRTILPNMTETTARGLDVWEKGEVSHSASLAVPMRAAGIEFMNVRTVTGDKVPSTMKVLGQLASLSPGMHDVVEFVYFVIGSASERPTKRFYLGGFSEKLREIGMTSLAATLTIPIGQHEAMHEVLYTAAANEKRSQLNPFQMSVARRAIKYVHTPAGVFLGRRQDAEDRRVGFGQVARVITGGDPEGFVQSTEAMTARILGTDIEYMNKFLAKRFRQCIEAANERELLAA